MSKTLVNQIVYAIKEGRFDVSEHLKKNRKTVDDLIHDLQLFPVKNCSLLKKSYPHISEIPFMESLCPEFYSTYTAFYVIGCPLSTDIDVLVLVDNLTKSIPNELFSSECERLMSELSLLGYDLSRTVDINLISIQSGRCVGKSKGGDEILNILADTYKNHKQMYPLCEIHLITPDRFERLSTISKFIMDNLRYLAKDYNKDDLREIRRKTYSQGVEEMLKLSLKLIDDFEFDESIISENSDWKSCMKSLTMKLLQLVILYENNICCYTKNELAELSPNYGLNKDNISYFLFRGTRGTYSEIEFRRLFSFYEKYVTQYFDELQVTVFTIPLDKIHVSSTLDRILIQEFMKSPNNCTQAFIDRWNVLNLNDTDIQTYFPISPTPPESINLPTQLIEQHFIQLEQRSDEWRNLLANVYVCGTNSKTITTVEGKYNLLRGCLTESIISHHLTPEMLGFDNNDWQKVNVGLLVENKTPKSRGCAPDLLLANGNQVVGIEIKAMQSLARNSDYYRSLKLAKNQLQSIQDILGAIVIAKIIILACWNDDCLQLECITVK